MPLLKAVFLPIYTYCFHLVLQPPQPPAPNHERIISTSLDVSSYRFWRVFGALAFQDVLFCIEFASCIATLFPSRPLSQMIMSTFSFGYGRLDTLHLSYLSCLGLAMTVLASIIRSQAYDALGRFFRYELSIQAKHELIVTGPYSIVRHPGYTGLLLNSLGWFLWNGASGSWIRESGILSTVSGALIVAAFSIWCIIGTPVVTIGRMSLEDVALKNRFGREWDEWAKRVPYSIFPGVY